MACKYKRKVIDGKRWLIHRYIALVVLGLEEKCSCGSVKKIIVHHIDENRYNNSKENLKVMCQSCHSIHHNKGKQAWNKGKPFSKKTRKKMSVAAKKKIETKEARANRLSALRKQSTRDKISQSLKEYHINKLKTF